MDPALDSLRSKLTEHLLKYRRILIGAENQTGQWIDTQARINTIIEGVSDDEALILQNVIEALDNPDAYNRLTPDGQELIDGLRADLRLSN